MAETRFGPMIHAQLFPGEENSGRLVTLLKNRAKALAQERHLNLILADGPPGIGCPVISSLAGTNLAVVVSEPTPSGIPDLKRVIDLCDHFRLPALVTLSGGFGTQLKPLSRRRKIKNARISWKQIHSTKIT